MLELGSGPVLVLDCKGYLKCSPALELGYSQVLDLAYYPALELGYIPVLELGSGPTLVLVCKR